MLKKLEFLDQSAENEEETIDQIKKFGREQDLIYNQMDDLERMKTVVENDNISHFVCRLAYCRTEELRKWYLVQESRLFKLKVSMECKKKQSVTWILPYLDQSNIQMTSVSDEEWG